MPLLNHKQLSSIIHCRKLLLPVRFYAAAQTEGDVNFINYHQSDLAKKCKSGKYTEGDLEKMSVHDLHQLLSERGIDTKSYIDKLDLINKAMEEL